MDGSGTGRFDLDAVAFPTVMTALDAMAGKPDPAHALVHRTLCQRRADALAEMAMAYGPEEDGTAVPDMHGRHNPTTIEAVVGLNLNGRSSAYATTTASSTAVTGPGNGATSTTSFPDTTADPPHWTTSSSCAATTTPSAPSRLAIH